MSEVYIIGVYANFVEPGSQFARSGEARGMYLRGTEQVCYQFHEKGLIIEMRTHVIDVRRILQENKALIDIDAIHILSVGEKVDDETFFFLVWRGRGSGNVKSHFVIVQPRYPGSARSFLR